MRWVVLLAGIGLALGIGVTRLSSFQSSAREERAMPAAGEEFARRPAPLVASGRGRDSPSPVQRVSLPHVADEPATNGDAHSKSVLDQLMAGGFARARAEEILKQEEQLRLAAFHEEYRATGTIRPFNGSAQLRRVEGLRKQLGDADYERYLEATGQPTRVSVHDVAADSAAGNAGLLPGDEIITYAGQRVFNSRELQTLARSGSSEELVDMSVVRDGYPVHLYVTRGSLGLATSARLRE